MAIRSVVLPFAVGFAAGFLVARHWDSIREAVEPVARRVVRRGREAATLGREKLWEQRERVEDLIAEWRERGAPPLGVEPGTAT